MARGRVVVDVERCKGCELCLASCPPGVLTTSEQLNSHGYRPASLLDPSHRCTGCALCAVVCPEACLTVFREVRPAAGRRRREVRANG